MGTIGISVYNTMHRQKEELIPRDKDSIGIYVCGVTPYSDTHLGHARPSVVWDVIKKFLQSQGYNTKHIQNFTDVDDKIIARANEQGIPALELSAKYIKEHLESMDALGVARADVYPKVSEHMDDIIEFIAGLVENGHAYESEGNVFFDVPSFSEYGKLSNQRREELLEGTRFEVDPAKHNPADFALWKKAKPGEPAWDSPWGQGRPGWHIECSAMSYKYLGSEFDFHGGGTDLIFPHHENEIAQTEAATGQPLARYWVHNGMLNLKAAKMSKSTGNFVSVKDLVNRYPKELIRFYILSTHYRSELEYYEGKLEEVSRGWQRLNTAVVNLRAALAQANNGVRLDSDDESLVSQIQGIRDDMIRAMADDFNTAQALGLLFDLVRDINGYIAHSPILKTEVLQAALGVFEEFGRDIFGIISEADAGGQSGLVAPLMDLVLELRQELRKERNFALADKIRLRLSELGITVEDTPQGPRWKV